MRLLLLALVPACALTTRSAPRELRYFAPEIAAELAPPGPTCARVRLGRVEPSANLRLAIARRISPVELVPYETLRWTEPPQAYARRALVRALFVAHPLEQAVAGPVATLDVDVLAFEEVGHGGARVALHYELRDDHRVLARGTRQVERTATTPAIEAVVVALGGALATASDELAERVVAATCGP